MQYKLFGPLARLTFMAFLVSAIMVIRNTLVQLDLIYVSMNNQVWAMAQADINLKQALLHPENYVVYHWNFSFYFIPRQSSISSKCSLLAVINQQFRTTICIIKSVWPIGS